MVDYRLPTYTMDLPTFVDAKKHELAIDLKVSKLGTIESYDEKTCTATVKLKTLFNEKTPYNWEYPDLSNVPVVKNKYISHPIKKGDGCLVIFLDTDFSAWLDNGERQIPNTPRLHNLNDPIAIVGIDTLRERASFGNTNIEINADDGKVDIKNKDTDIAKVLKKILDCLTNLDTKLKGNKFTPTAQGGIPTPIDTGSFSSDITAIKNEAEKLIEGVS